MTTRQTATGDQTGSPVSLCGITWNHPRGYAPLETLSELDRLGAHQYGQATGTLIWERQPLEGFESTPLSDLADRYDLLVIDHPHLADAVEAQALLPLDTLVDAAELDRWRARTAGASFDSYQHQNRQWAVPLDAAAQVAAVHPDGPPAQALRTWNDVLTHAVRHSITLCLGGPHAFLTFTSIALAHGAAPGGAGKYLPRAQALSALDLLARLYQHCDRATAAGNPITVLESVAAGAGPAVCPLVYGYVTYSREPRLVFRDAPCGPDGLIGSVLGGTGVSVSARREHPEAAASHVRRLMSPSVQQDLVPQTGGQPSSRAAWASEQINDDWSGFYRNTIRTLDAAWVRPRRPGWVSFQDAASQVIREGLAGKQPSEAITDRIDTLYSRFLSPIS
ncbi:carbohydrate ABC transporter substrate-binding protein [Streptomyces sp. NEAU-YJ-81]|uniref:carbohydrate ABC transporter substrate-binding protein n=1 Tax=Streptomyces sp. NEAU-YJ-81 TaxID=2820288 RepID=UPI001ABCB247|nr:carbohydrate ABC transporter substrate-binding protein [Streptomyces sp. NEAU-YJ-81]MBO3677024.1 carbohydrate ABC transporter substrate-binding protein [Streptomyces sp. NEAU-YJ-81]